MPRKYEALVELLKKYPAGKIDVVLQRLIKCYHPSLAEGNKKLLSKLFLYLLRYYDDMSNGPLSGDTMKVLGSLTKAMYSLMKRQMCPGSNTSELEEAYEQAEIFYPVFSDHFVEVCAEFLKQCKRDVFGTHI
ncbi:hypothetical protein COOONC_10281 [Cooperia oncophora]